jgi:hypothetical protein
MRMASTVRRFERRGELLQDGAVGCAGVLYFATANMVVWRLQARRTHDNPGSPSCTGQTHGQVLIAMPFSYKSHGNGGSVANSVECPAP